MNKLLLSAILLGLLSACASTSDKGQGAASVEDKSLGQQAAGASTQGAQQQGMAMDPLKDPSNILSKRSVYFDYDSYSVKNEYKPMVEAHAQYLKQNAKAKAFIQGNADERGSREYNLALGQKRAESVRKVMNVLGVSDNQIETVSFGEEKPKAEGRDEDSWAQNRRADIVYQGE
ncbi:MAG: peptidoglycan-associated lipoprotein Pal [Pseudomonadota bacterium]|jgi:peptidoglycan-associated lipoprotein|nr:peptidoglycan-associated lipoprotein Pal [Gammaproteobacteria bacterium]MBU1733573.1 peptidoglycan-associated lipoprotein Pal [Gammaproteobacteria bacterium]MBU1891711.1 peptidoglycan-associated lipoprotein Pal [Gammaproteobacteria bacterium]